MNTRSSSQPGRPRSAEADQAILGAALKLLKDQGYVRMSVEAVAAEAGVGKTTIYRRYSNKEELVIAALETVVRQPEVPDSGSTRDDLHTVLGHFHSQVITKLGTSMLGTFMVEETHHPQLLKRFRRRIVQPRRDVLRTVLRRGIERGEVRSDIDIEMTVDFLTGGIIMRRLTTGKTSSHFTAQAIEAVWPAIGIR